MLLLFALPFASSAQLSERARRMADSSVARIMSDARAEIPLKDNGLGGPQWVLRILRQSDRPVPDAKIAELADSLTRIAIDGDPPGRTGYFSWAFQALLLAGNRGVRHGTPYRGTVDRLIRISNESQDRVIPAMARHAMLGVIEGERAIPYLRSLAILAGPEDLLTAADAVGTLITDAQGDGMSPPPRSQQLASMAVLKELFERRLVMGRLASGYLEAFAETQGWKRSP